MATERIESSYSPQGAVHKITQGLNAELIASNHYKIEDGELVVAVYQKYFFRNNSSAALVVTAVGDERGCKIDLVSTASGQGLLNIGWGANESFIQSAVNALDR